MLYPYFLPGFYKDFNSRYNLRPQKEIVCRTWALIGSNMVILFQTYFLFSHPSKDYN